MPGRPLSRRTAVGSALRHLSSWRRATSTRRPATTPRPPHRRPRRTPSWWPPSSSSWRAPRAAGSRRSPELAARLAPLAAAHAAHRELLVGAVAEAELPGASPTRVPDAPDRALTAVRRSEQRLLRQLREAWWALPAVTSRACWPAWPPRRPSTPQHCPRPSWAPGRRHDRPRRPPGDPRGRARSALHLRRAGRAHLAGRDARAVRRPHRRLPPAPCAPRPAAAPGRGGRRRARGGSVGVRPGRPARCVPRSCRPRHSSSR